MRTHFRVASASAPVALVLVCIVQGLAGCAAPLVDHDGSASPPSHDELPAPIPSRPFSVQSANALPATILFAPRVGGAPFSCTEPLRGIGKAHADAVALDFRVYIHAPALLRDDGARVPFELDQDGVWQTQSLALLDFEDRSGTCTNGTPETNMTLRGRVPPGRYVGIAFNIGVPEALNHGDATLAPSPLNLTSLFWSWTGGYKFARIDLRTDGINPVAFPFHMGSTGCSGKASIGSANTITCSHANVGQAVVVGIDPTTTPILADLAALFADTPFDSSTSPGCMSQSTDPDCVALLARLGVDPVTGAPHSNSQAMFHAP